MDAREKLGRAYELLQQLQAPMTRSNVNILASAFALMQEVYFAMDGKEGADGRAEADAEGRDGIPGR